MRRSRSLLVLLGTLLCVAATVGLFARAYPTVDTGLTLDRGAAIARARSLAARAGFAPALAQDVRTAPLFESSDSLSTYVDFAAGGADSVRALARGRDLALYRWVVRLFRPGDVHETRIAFAPDGRVIGLARRIPESETRPLVSDTAGRLAADAALAQWGSQDVARWRLTGRSTVTQPGSGRVDRTYRYERVGRRIGDAPIRADVTVTGAGTPAVLQGGAMAAVGTRSLSAADSAVPGTGFVGRYGAEPLTVRVYADLPDAWARRYGEMRASNDTFALLAYPGLTVFVLAAFGALIHYGRMGRVRWRPAAMVGGTVGVLMAAAGINELPVAWFGYDTATAPGAFVGSLTLGALASGAIAGLWVTLAVAAAEVCARRAFPTHYDWFSYPRFAGAPAIARRILGGYALAAFGFAYVTVFYVTMRGSFGWWVPTSSLDDPNLIATPAPWVGAAGTALFAGTWEEAIFRGVPLALLALWARGRRRRGLWLGVGVIVTALTFGFGHANYPSWPAYSRGVELFLEATLWAVLALRVGLPTTIIAHTLYDLTWFGLFALHGQGAGYRATAIAVIAAFSLPAVLVAVNWWQRRRAAAAGAASEVPPTFADVRRVLDERLVVRGRKGEGARDHVVPAAPVTSAPAASPVSAVTTGDVLAPTRAPTLAPAPITAPRVGPRTRLAAAAVTGLALLVALFAPRATPLGPAFTAPRARVLAAADSVLRARGVDPAAWDRTPVVATEAAGSVARFLRESLGRDRAATLVRQLGGTYLTPTLWNVRYVHRHAPRDVRREEWIVGLAPNGQARTAVHLVADDAPGGAPTADSARAIAAAAVRRRGYDPARLREVELTQTNRPRRLDTRLEYVDPAVPLPRGATARVAVNLAGTEAVRVARDVRLPEAWQLAQQRRSTTQGLIAGVAGLALFGLLLALLVHGVRRAEPRLPETVTGRTALAIAGAVGLLTLTGTLLSLPRRLAGWDTATPWSNFLATLVIVALLGAVLAGAISAGLWTLADALRRRAGVPFLPQGMTPGTAPDAPLAAGRARDALLLGAALGTALPALAGLADFVRTVAVVPPVPTTALDAFLPWGAPALAVVTAVLNAPLTALPALAIIVGARTPRARWVVLGVITVLLAVAAQVGADATFGPVSVTAAALAGLALVVGVIWAFGRFAALPWIVAGPAAALAAGIRSARLAANPVDRTAELIGVGVAAVLLVVLYQTVDRIAARATDHPERPAGSVPGDPARPAATHAVA